MPAATTDELDDDLQTWTAEEVATRHLKNAVKASWLEKQACLQRIPARKVGRSWRWAAEDIRALIAQCLVEPKPRRRR